ncbi:MAG: ATP-binding protein [Candidatus Tectimicrobiota bacterium]
MPFYRPRSFLQLVLSGFALVMSPLIVAVITATIRVDRLADQSQHTVSRTVQVLQSSRTLSEQVTAMERYIRQFQALGGESLFQAYTETHEKFQQGSHNLSSIVRDPSQEQHLLALIRKEHSIFEAVQTHLRQPEGLATLTPEFTMLKEMMRAMLVENDKITDMDIEAMREEATKVQHLLGWQAIAFTLGAVVFSGLFVGLISRPIRQIDQAIQRLGAGEFTTGITITGPRDLQYLGERLNWLRSRLRELDDEKRKFLQHVSHELKTPLTALREGTALLEEGVVGQLNEAQHEIVDILDQNGVQLQKLIEDLLNFHLAQARTASLTRQLVPLEQLIDEVLHDHKLAMRAKAITVERALVPTALWVDQEKLRIAIDNLLSNAVKYSPQAGTIHVSLTQDATRAIVDVVDTGPGIPLQDRERVFEAFYQGSTTYEGHVKGSGLGLAIAREYVTAHQGKLEIVTEGLQGAHFRLSLPLRTAKELV